MATLEWYWRTRGIEQLHRNPIEFRRCTCGCTLAPTTRFVMASSLPAAPSPNVTPVATSPSRTVSDAIDTRRSVREFTAQPVSLEVMRRLVQASARAATGGNIQPWKAYVLAGEAKRRVCDAVLSKIRSEGRFAEDDLEYDIYPLEMSEWTGEQARYMANRRQLGYEMYSLMGIGRKDRKARIGAMLKNFEFFGAPEMGAAQWCDLGCFLTNLMLLCREEGLHTCAQEAWATFPKAVKTAAGIPEREVLFCGLAVGYADPQATVNKLKSKRNPLSAWAKFDGFGANDSASRSKL